MTKDPHFKREQQKYIDPIPSREFILELLTSTTKLLTRDQIAKALNIIEPAQREALRRRLRAMERDGQLVFSKEGYELPERMALIDGEIIGHPDGFGFLKPDDGTSDLFIPHRCMRYYFHEERVQVQQKGFDRKGRRECRIIRLVEGRRTPIVGRYIRDGKVAFVQAKDKRITQDIIISKLKGLQARHDDIVVVELLTRPTYKSSAEGKILEILGKEDKPGMEIEIALRHYDLPHTWSSGIAKQLKQLSDHVTDKDREGRIDMRHLPLVTIDGSDSRDFDDAVYAEKRRGGGFKLWVAIADVSHYVKKGSRLDMEAQARGNSVYFPSQVLPMLPEELSNGLCSLNPHVDRLCMVCEMTVSAEGKLSRFKFYPAVMHSHARLTYEEVSQALEEGEVSANIEPVLTHLETLRSLYELLFKAREERGAIGFETQEMQFVFNEFNRIDKIVPRDRNVAHKIIEECMILANVSAAKFIIKHKAETLYRVHESPSEEKLVAFQSFISEKGLVLTGGLAPTPKDYALLIKKVSDRPDKKQIQTLLLRSMRQARYTPDNDGHFGLALQQYAHFTSPIRRYPDLQLHRAIRYLLAKEKSEVKENWTADGGYLYSVEELDVLGDHCSMTERRADDATREVSDWLKCDYMQDHIGAEFEATVASVTSFGFFARLNSLFIDGLVHMSQLTDDFYQYDPLKQMLIGEKFRRTFRVGDLVKVRVSSVNMDDKQIDFVLYDAPKKAVKSASSKSKKKTTKSNSKKKSATSSKSKTQGSTRERLRRGEIGESKTQKKQSKKGSTKRKTEKPKQSKKKKSRISSDPSRQRQHRSKSS